MAMLEIIPYFGFKAIYAGDEYFDKVKMLCHFNDSALTNVIDKKSLLPPTALWVNQSAVGQKGVIQIVLLNQFDNYIDPLAYKRYNNLFVKNKNAFENLSITKKTEYDSRYFLTYSDDITPEPDLLTRTEWYRFNDISNDLIRVNGVLIEKSKYTGDYGAGLSVLGNDWCFEARICPFHYISWEEHFSSGTNLNLLNQGDLRILYNTYGISVEYAPMYKYNESENIFNPSKGFNRSFYFPREISTKINSHYANLEDAPFVFIRVFCKDGIYRCFVDGIECYAEINYASIVTPYILPVSANSWCYLSIPALREFSYRYDGEKTHLIPFTEQAIQHEYDNNENLIGLEKKWDVDVYVSNKRIYKEANKRYDYYYRRPIFLDGITRSAFPSDIQKNWFKGVNVTNQYVEVFFGFIYGKESHKFYFDSPIKIVREKKFDIGLAASIGDSTFFEDILINPIVEQSIKAIYLVKIGSVHRDSDTEVKFNVKIKNLNDEVLSIGEYAFEKSTLDNSFHWDYWGNVDIEIPLLTITEFDSYSLGYDDIRAVITQNKTGYGLGSDNYVARNSAVCSFLKYQIIPKTFQNETVDANGISSYVGEGLVPSTFDLESVLLRTCFFRQYGGISGTHYLDSPFGIASGNTFAYEKFAELYKNNKLTLENDFSKIGETEVVEIRNMQRGEKPIFSYGVDKVKFSLDGVTLFFDDTFVENEHKFELSNTENLTNKTSFVLTTDIFNNKFKVSILYFDSANKISRTDNFEFTATYNKKDLRTYSAAVYDDTSYLTLSYSTDKYNAGDEIRYLRPNSAYGYIGGYGLDEARFTIGASREEDAYLVPTEPFPDVKSSLRKLSLIPSFDFIHADNPEIKKILPKKVPASDSFSFPPEIPVTRGVISNYNRYDPLFDHVQLLLHAQGKAGEKFFIDAAGHFPEGIKTTRIEKNDSVAYRDSVILLDGQDYGGIDVSTNNKFNRVSSFNLCAEFDELPRKLDVEWSFECFFKSFSDTFEDDSGKWLVSNSYEPNSENGYNTGVDWGIKLYKEFIVVVVGKKEYRFSVYGTGDTKLETGYANGEWQYILIEWRKWTFNKTGDEGFIQVWLGNGDDEAATPIGFSHTLLPDWNGIDFIPIKGHQAPYKNYFRIGRANTPTTLHALLDEVRFTIGGDDTKNYSRCYDLESDTYGHIPKLAFPNIKDDSHRPKIEFEIESSFIKLKLNSNYASVTALVSIEPEFNFRSTDISIEVAVPTINLSIKKTNGIDVYFGLGAPVNFDIRLTGNATNVPIKLPELKQSLTISSKGDSFISGALHPLEGFISIKKSGGFAVAITIPDMNVVAQSLPSVSLKSDLPELFSSIFISDRAENAIDIFGAFNAPVLNLALSKKQKVDISCSIPLPNFGINVSNKQSIDIRGVITPAIDIAINKNSYFNLPISLPSIGVDIVLSPPLLAIEVNANKIAIDLRIENKPKPITDWFSEIFSGTALNKAQSSDIHFSMPLVKFLFVANKQPEINTQINLKKLQVQISISENAQFQPQSISVPITLPALEFDFKHRVMDLGISIPPPDINFKSSSWSTFL